jgi:hypothetical protein
MLREELERKARGEPLQALEADRFRVEHPPEARRGDPKAWQDSLRQARTHLEHQTARHGGARGARA